MKKDRITGIDFERMMLAGGIIAFHYYCHSSSEKKLFLYVNSLGIGKIITTCFFILSGAMLFYNHEIVENIPKFYLKRFKTIFPAFWIAYFIEYMRNVVNTGAVFWIDAPKPRLIFSIIGMDGYLYDYFNGQDYYILGEWFLGVIIILYLTYPLLAWLMKKNLIITTICVYTAYVCYIFFSYQVFFDLIIYITYFYTGMLIFRFKNYLFDSKISLLVSSVLCLILIVIKINENSIFYLLYSLGVFVIFQRIGSLVERKKIVKNISKFVGEISYEIFLVQHLVILRALSVKDPVNTNKSIIMIFIIMFLCIIYAKLLNITASGVVLMFTKKNREIE